MDRAETIFDTISLKCKIVLKFIMEFEFLSNLDLTYLCRYVYLCGQNQTMEGKSPMTLIR